MPEAEREIPLSHVAQGAPDGARKPWQTPEVQVLDVALDTQVNTGLGSDAGPGSSHS